MKKLFKSRYTSSKSRARVGEIKTDHGIIKTPAFVPVATKGTLKSLLPNLTKDIGIQIAFVNTYHLVTHPGAEIIAKGGGIHKYANFNIPLMSDSGGFQVFSLAKNKFVGVLATQHRGEEVPMVVKISDDGVKFRSVFDGEMIEFTPEKSIEFQRKIGADLIMAFDECTYYPATYEYTKKAMKRTHEWLKRCIKAKSQILNHPFDKLRVLSLSKDKSQINNKSQIQNPKRLEFRNSNLSFDFAQDAKLVEPFGTCNLEFSTYLYGIIHGGIYEDLRKKSAEFVVSQNIDGVAIGGVSVGETKAEMRDQVRWVCDYLPKDKPVHLLGVGQIDDIIDLVKYGIDTFDCVEPTRLARMGTIYQLNSSEIDIQKGKYRYDLSTVDENCSCYVCKNFTKSYLHHLFKQRELLGYTLATYHNLWVMERLMEKIRKAIEQNIL